MRHPRNSFRLGQWAVSTKHHHPSLSLYWYDLLLIEPGNSFESVESWFTTVPCLIKIELFILSCICRFVFLQRRHGLMTTTIGFAFPQRKKKVSQSVYFGASKTTNHSLRSFFLTSVLCLIVCPTSWISCYFFSLLVSTLLCVLSQSWIGANIRIVIGILLSCRLSRVFQ